MAKSGFRNSRLRWLFLSCIIILSAAAAATLVAVLLFAFATIVCWAHYGKESLRYVTKNRAASACYLVLFTLFVFIGAVSASSYAWLFADLSLGIMTIINLPVLFAMRAQIKEETELYFGRN